MHLIERQSFVVQSFARAIRFAAPECCGSAEAVCLLSSSAVRLGRPHCRTENLFSHHFVSKLSWCHRHPEAHVKLCYVPSHLGTRIFWVDEIRNVLWSQNLSGPKVRGTWTTSSSPSNMAASFINTGWKRCIMPFFVFTCKLSCSVQLHAGTG